VLNNVKSHKVYINYEELTATFQNVVQLQNPTVSSQLQWHQVGANPAKMNWHHVCIVLSLVSVPNCKLSPCYLQSNTHLAVQVTCRYHPSAIYKSIIHIHRKLIKVNKERVYKTMQHIIYGCVHTVYTCASWNSSCRRVTCSLNVNVNALTVNTAKSDCWTKQSTQIQPLVVH